MELSINKLLKLNGTDEEKGFQNVEILKEDEDKFKEKKINEQDEKFAGWENFPVLCLKLVSECPFIYDILKQDTLKYEFAYLNEDNN